MTDEASLRRLRGRDHGADALRRGERDGGAARPRRGVARPVSGTRSSCWTRCRIGWRGECTRQNLAAGMFALAGYGADGEPRYRVTEAGKRRVEEMLRKEPPHD